MVQVTFNIRLFKPADLRKVMEINRLCLPENYSSFFFLDLYKRFPTTFVVAEENGEVVGYIMCRIEKSWGGFSFLGSKKGHVVSVAVLPEHRRKGVGCALMREAMRNMLEYGVEECYLEVRVSNVPAVRFYEKLGFKIDRTVRGYYADREGAYVMTRELPSESVS
ncbi:MAG: ribosomal protein S18-alanine N-acetyltransferase [Thermoproteota archaeon]|nr:ribosomal protein S18-alanine N-acetyltransferase [Thermoproteota archaeon]